MEENVMNEIRIANLMSSEIAIIAPRWFPLLEFKKDTDETGSEIYRYDELIPEAEKLAEKIKEHNPLAVSYAKQAVTRGLDISLKQGLQLEARLGHRLRTLSGTRKN